MKRSIKIIAVLLVLLNTIAALFGGSNLIEYPDGSSLSLSLTWLQHSPFQNYFIPGLILLICNGLFGITILAIVISGYKKCSWLFIAQGVILCGFIVVQVSLIRTIIGLHVFMTIVGVILILSGISLKRFYRE